MYTGASLGISTLRKNSIGCFGLSVAVFVIILVLIATITLSLLLRRPPQSGEGLSLRNGASGATLALVDDRDEQIRG